MKKNQNKEDISDLEKKFEILEIQYLNGAISRTEYIEKLSDIDVELTTLLEAEKMKIKAKHSFDRFSAN